MSFVKTGSVKAILKILVGSLPRFLHFLFGLEKNFSTGDVCKNLLSGSEFCERRCESHTLLRVVSSFYICHIYFLNRLKLDVRYLNPMLLCREDHIFLRTYTKLHLLVFCKAVWHFLCASCQSLRITSPSEILFDLTTVIIYEWTGFNSSSLLRHAWLCK